MAKRNTKMVMHSFYCISCGNKSYELPRPRSKQHERFHRKRLYCLNCKQEINHIECKNDEDVFDFKEDFRNGVFLNEKEESISFVRSAW